MATSKVDSRTARFSRFLVLGHTVNDASTNSLPGFLPVVATLYDLSYLLAGALAMVMEIASSILQPLLGHWYDRTRVAWILQVGIAVNCIAIGLVGISASYGMLLMLVGISGLGHAAFHPPAFSAVAESSASSRGRAMGVFISGGNVGVFLGPIMAGLLISTFELRGMLLFIPVGLVTSGVLLGVRPPNQPRLKQALTEKQPVNKRLLALLATITAFRSIAIRSAVIFMPLYFVSRGESLLAATSIVSFWLAGGVVGQVGGGMLSDRVGRRIVIGGSLFAGALMFLGFLNTSGLLSLAFLVMSGPLLYASWSAIMAMSSEAAPSNVGAVSGFMLGFAVGIGGLAALGFGVVADVLGFAWAFSLVISFALAGGLMAFLLPSYRPHQY